MGEIIPVVLGIILGSLVRRGAGGAMRAVLSLFAAAVCGLFATVIAGEYQISWLYLLPDLGEATLGLAIGFAVASRLPTRFARTGPAHSAGG